MPTAVHEEKALLLNTLRELLPSISKYTDRQLVTKIGKGVFEDFALQVDGFISASCGIPLSLSQEVALLDKVLKCLTTYLRDTLRIPVTINTIVNNVHLLPHSVDVQFPSYSEQRMLLAIVTPQQLPRVGV